MSYVVQSSENTIKVILNSQLATHGTPSRPQFTLKTPIETPYNQTGLVNLESLALRAPSMFTARILNDINNSITISSLADAADAYLEAKDDNVDAGEPTIVVMGSGGTYHETGGAGAVDGSTATGGTYSYGGSVATG
jgi:hypothetical protein